MLIFDTYTVDAEKNNFLCKTSIKLFFHSTRYIVYFEKRHYSFIKNVGRLSQTIHQVQISFTTKDYRFTMWHSGLQSTFLKVCIKPFSFKPFGSPSNKTCLLHQEKNNQIHNWKKNAWHPFNVQCSNICNKWHLNLHYPFI